MTTEEIRSALTSLEPTRLEIEDQSAAHAHHKHNPAKGEAGGGTHFAVRIESARFTGQSALARHRLIYAALGNAFAGQLHALAIEATAPGE